MQYLNEFNEIKEQYYYYDYLTKNRAFLAKITNQELFTFLYLKENIENILKRFKKSNKKYKEKYLDIMNQLINNINDILKKYNA